MKKYKNKKMKMGMKKAMYKDATNGVGMPQYWNLISASKGMMPQNYQMKTLPMNNDK